MKMKLTGFQMALCSGLVAVCSSSAAFAQAGDSMAADKMFAMQADEGNTAEITTSQLALKKSKNPEVKTYAQQMITDHTKLRSDMAPLASQMGVTTPQPLNATHKAESQRLMAMSGKDFDMEYIKAMDMDHHKTLGMFQNEAANTQNADLKAAVQQATTVIQQHTDMADQMAQKMSIPVASTPGQ